jgi:ribonuclease D
VRQLKRDARVGFANLFDTRAAAAICGHASPGLGTILDERFGVAVNKKFQRADWTKRPLSHSMLSYAQSDVAYLHELKGLLEVELEQLGRMPILQTEHERLCAIEPAGDPYPLENYARIKGAAHLDGRERRRLRELYNARNEFAEKRNRAPFRIVNNHILIELSRNPVYDVQAFAQVRGLNHRIATQIAKSMTSAARRADELGSEEGEGHRFGPSKSSLVG